jgi:hypothetical protein
MSDPIQCEVCKTEDATLVIELNVYDISKGKHKKCPYNKLRTYTCSSCCLSIEDRVATAGVDRYEG